MAESNPPEHEDREAVFMAMLEELGNWAWERATSQEQVDAIKAKWLDRWTNAV